MSASLVAINWPSIYPETNPGPLPARMAKCTPDMKAAIAAASTALAAKGGKLILSDLFRSYQMQYDANQDYVTGRKSSYSPPPGGSLHEAGRAFDMDLAAMKISLADFWILAAKVGLVPIIAKPKANAKEAWHFECRGSHQLVYDYYQAGKGGNFAEPYTAMAASAIVSIGVKVDKFGSETEAAYLQSGLIRLGATIGDMDAAIGKKTKTALADLGIANGPIKDMVAGVEAALKAKFPAEY